MIIGLMRRIIILIFAILGIMFIVSSFYEITGKITGRIVGEVGENIFIENINFIGGILGILLIVAALLLYIQLKYEEKMLKE